MAYPNPASSLTPEEIVAEATKLLALLKDSDWETRASERAQEFLSDKYTSLDMFDAVGCTIKQLWFLRDLADQLL